MSSPFLLGGAFDLSVLQDGSTPINVASAVVGDLAPSLPVHTDASRQLTSGLIQASDCGFDPVAVSPTTSVVGNLPAFTVTDGSEVTDSGVSAQETAATIDAAGPLAPPGLRDNWQVVGAGAAGAYLDYSPTLGIAFTFGFLTGLSTSSDGGATWGTPVFDVAPTVPQILGLNSSVVCSVGYGATETYTSPDGINFTKGVAHPATLPESFNICWFGAASLFVTGATNAGQRIMTSPTGAVWTLRTATPQALTIKANSSICVAVGSVSPFAMWSEDGITWTGTASTITSSRSLEWSEERQEWVTIGVSSRVVYRSTDGKVWTATGVVVPAAMNNTLSWVSQYHRYYYSAPDTDNNYSLWTSLSPYEQFVSTHLDGAVNNVPDYGFMYLSQYDRFLIGGNSSPYIAYSTASTKIKATSDHIAVRGAPVAVCKFSAYSDVTVDNTTTETTISAPASSLGSYALQDSQALGLKWISRLVFIVSSVAGDTLTIKYKKNGTTQHTVVITVPAGAANLPIHLTCWGTIRAATCEYDSMLNVSTVAAVLANASGAWTRTVINTLSLTATWGANVNQCRVADQSLLVSYMNGQP